MSAILIMTALMSSLATTTVKLNNGIDMPALAFGASVWDAETCSSATTAALQAPSALRKP